VDSVPWGFCLVMVGGLVVAYLFDQVPFVAIAIAGVALVGLSVTVHTGPWWAKEAVAGLLAGVVVETLRAV
jgi:hydrogenase/urease accessory protein HupE